MNSHDENPDIHLVTVLRIEDEVEAELIKNRLIENGIQCALDGEHQGGFTGTLPVGILVRGKRPGSSQKNHRRDASFLTIANPLRGKQWATAG